MDIKSLQDKIKVIDQKTTPKYKLYTQKEKEILTRTIKLNEEVGELCNDVLSVLRLQRRAKLEKFDKRNFYEEFADVILTTIHLANSAGVDLERAIRDKMKKLEIRHQKSDKILD